VGSHLYGGGGKTGGYGGYSIYTPDIYLVFLLEPIIMGEFGIIWEGLVYLDPPPLCLGKTYSKTLPIKFIIFTRSIIF